MNLDLDDDQQALRDTLLELFEKESTTADVRAAEPDGFDESLWQTVAAMGIPSIAVPAEQGGGGAGLLELAVAAECAGAALAPIPLVDSAATTTLLASLPGASAFSDLVERAIAGEAITTMAVRPVADGTARVVPSGAVADLVVALRGDELVAVETGGRREVVPNVGNLPIAHLAVGDDAVVLARGDAARANYDRGLALWRALSAASLMGLAGRALQIGVEYVKERQAFGVVIANFQTIQHRLAENAVAVEGGRLLAYEAAWAQDVGQANAADLAKMAFLFAGDNAFRTAGDSLHFHGGYGFSMEYDIQLFFRRAKGWSLIAGDPRHLYAELGRAAATTED
jgi:alkylation response protein AidB-like acyl-CoA dehydrogenase